MSEELSENQEINEIAESAPSGGKSWSYLLRNLSVEQIKELELIFKAKYANDNKATNKGLNKEEFVNVISNFIGTKYNYCSEALRLFDAISANLEKMTIEWNDFLDYLLENCENPVPDKLHLSLESIEPATHENKESIIKIVLIETNKYFCYAMISKHGRVGVYDGNLNFLTSYHVIMTREDINRKEEERRRRNRWITDAIYAADNNYLIVTNSARTLIIYDASRLNHVPLYLIISSPNIIECLAYRSTKDKCFLYMGDSTGGLIGFKFLQPKNGLFRVKSTNKLSLFYWEELFNEKDYLAILNLGKVHRSSILKLEYFQDCLISCSRDRQFSLVKKYLDQKKQIYVLQLKKGCCKFAISNKLKIIITGSDDGTLTIWNATIVTKHLSVLKRHKCGIVDVKILDRREVFLSLSRDAELNIWDLNDYKCMQSMVLPFPCFDILGKSIEWGKMSIYPGSKRQLTKTSNDNLVNNCMGLKESCEVKNIDNNSICDDFKKNDWKNEIDYTFILITCCNFIAKIKLHSNEIMTDGLDMPILPPPPLQNSVLIPCSWKISDGIEKDLLLTKKIQSDADFENFEKKRPLGVDFILNKNLLKEMRMCSTINQEIALLEKKKLQMQKNVALGAPYLALDLYEVEELTLNVPVMPTKRKVKRLVDNMTNLLTVSVIKDQILSSASSSSRSKSSRSSTVEFPL